MEVKGQVRGERDTMAQKKEWGEERNENDPFSNLKY